MTSTSKGNAANIAASQRSASGSGSGSVPSPFFLKERERLITDIADVSVQVCNFSKANSMTDIQPLCCYFTGYGTAARQCEHTK